MATIAVFGGTGYAGGHIKEEALRRGYVVISASRKDSGTPDRADLIERTGNIHDPAFVDQIAAEADVVVVAVPARAQDGVRLVDVIPTLTTAVAAHATRLGVVGGAGSLYVYEGGPRVVDMPDFPDAYKGEALGQADMLTALEQTPANVDWFYLSPAAEFGSHNPGEAIGTFRIGGDVLLGDSEGASFISGADYAKAFVDEIAVPAHRRKRFSVAY